MSIDIQLQFSRGDFKLDCDVSIPGSGITSLFGPSGSGKTSILRAIAGLDRHRNCVLTVNGECWQGNKRFIPPHQRPIGYVFQEPSLFPHLNVERNIRFGLSRVPADERKLSLDQVTDWLDLKNMLHRQVDGLSGGERQRVAIARALAVSPRLLLLDEPLAAVDVNRKQELLPYLEALHRELDMPIIHVSHLPDEVARLADHLVLLEDGRVCGEGPAVDLFSRLDLPMARIDTASSLLEARILNHQPKHRLSVVGPANPGGEPFELLVPQLPAASGTSVRLQLAARDVSITLQRQSGTSILNILPARVEEIAEPTASGVLLRLNANGTTILSRITQKSVQELGLHTGMEVFAQVKSIAVLS